MSILSALKQNSSSIDDLAKLPQAMIMQMAQKKSISAEMVAPILARKAEMMEAVARSRALQQPAMPPTVMEQLMAKNIQAENPQMVAPPQRPMPQPMQQAMPQMMPQMPAEAGVAQLPIPERQYAGGGIIAFADGGMSDEDDDYEDALEEADYQAMIERAMSAGEDDSTPRFETRQAAGSPQSFPNTARKVGIATPKEQKGDLEARLRATILEKESGNRRYDKNGKLLTSSKGAEGEMQVMPYTAKDPGFGIKPAKSNDPDELRRVGDEYASAMLKRYKDPKLAMIAYNMGPGATDKWLASGADPRRLPKETQGYIRNVNLAQGGEIKRYVGNTDGSLVEDDEPTSAFERFFNQKEYLKDYQTKLAKQREFEKVTREQPGMFDKTTKAQRDKAAGDLAAANQARSGIKALTPEQQKTAETKNVTPLSNAPTDQEFRDFDYASALFQAENMGKTVPVQAQAEAPKSRLDQYMEKMMAREAAIDKQKGDDKNMALLAAGLGMLGGTSSNAFTNIGQGALAGVQNLSESRKQRAAEQAALDKSMLYATRYQGAEELNKQTAAYNRAMKQQQYELDVAKYGTEKEKIAVNAYNTHIKTQMDALIAKNQVLVNDEAGMAKALNGINNEPVTIQLRKKAFPDLPIESSSRTTFTPKQESLLSKYLPK